MSATTDGAGIVAAGSGGSGAGLLLGGTPALCDGEGADARAIAAAAAMESSVSFILVSLSLEDEAGGRDASPSGSSCSSSPVLSCVGRMGA